MPAKSASFLVLFLLFAISTFGQNVLMLDKSGTRKKTFFKSGDDIRYKLKGEDHFRQDYIVSIKDSSLIFHYNKININEISTIDIRNKNFIKFNLKQAGTLLQISGAMYIVLDQFNKNVVQGREWEFEDDVWITGAVLIAAGTGVKFLHPRKFKVGGRYNLRIININYLY